MIKIFKGTKEALGMIKNDMKDMKEGMKDIKEETKEINKKIKAYRKQGFTRSEAVGKIMEEQFNNDIESFKI